MDEIFGLIGMAIYIVAVVALAAGVTYLVVKLSPSKSAKQAKPAAPTP